MAELIKNCEFCGEPYKVCPNCQPKKVYQWRMHYCSHVCFFGGENRILNGGENIMRIEYDKKTWTLKDYNLDTDTYILPNDIELKADEITNFIMNAEEYAKILKHIPKSSKKTTKATTKTEETVE